MPGGKPDTILLEDLALAVVPHGPFLLDRLTQLASREGQRPEGRLLVLGGVDFDGTPGKGELWAADLCAPATAGKRLIWKSLPGTQREQRQIADISRQVFKEAPLLLSGRDASVARLREELPKVRYAHLATHGFFADPQFRSAFQIDERQFQRQRFERASAGARSPLVLSGLVLAGANRADEKADPDRGILTAEALVSLRLNDMDLAVLSACETGLGEVAGGEGVFGLTRAFHLAGTRNVVASLWKVDDDATAALMALFYRNLWIEKKEPLEALRQAQLYLYRHPEQIAALAKTRGADFTAKELPKVSVDPAVKETRSHPGKWAAFVLSGTGK